MINKKIIIDKANRLHQMAPDILSFIQTSTLRPILKKQDLVNLGDLNWPVPFEEFPNPTAKDLAPASLESLNGLKEDLVAWFEKHQHTNLVGAKEIYLGGNIRSLLFLLAVAYIEPGDIAFVPELGIPLYRKVITACGGEPINYSISCRHNWSPGFERISTHLGRVARALIINSPHNPTGFELDEKEMTELAWIAGHENLLLINDAAYQSIPERRPVSLLSVTGGKKVGVEVYSFAYNFGLPPLPFGFIAGNREIINAVKQAATLLPDYIPEYYIRLASRAVRQYPGESLRAVRKALAAANSEAVGLLEEMSLERTDTGTVPFIWGKIQKGDRNSTSAARQFYRRYRILVAPGNAFGDSGQGYFRLSLTAPAGSYQEAAQRLKKKLKLLKKRDNQ
ncbi:MAG: aminotransferase class I/II-fold pyridoxal phosphate-dependent enzyme [Candidatus Zixiibacteriota bacterium]